MSELALLSQATKPKDIIFALQEECQLSRNDIASALDILPSHVRSCLYGTTLAPVARVCLQDLKDLCLLLSQVLEKYHIARWLNDINPDLGRRTALELIATGETKKLKRAINKLIRESK